MRQEFPSPRGDKLQRPVCVTLGCSLQSFRPLAGISCNPRMNLSKNGAKRFRPLAGISCN